MENPYEHKEYKEEDFSMSRRDFLRNFAFAFLYFWSSGGSKVGEVLAKEGEVHEETRRFVSLIARKVNETQFTISDLDANETEESLTYDIIASTITQFNKYSKQAPDDTLFKLLNGLVHSSMGENRFNTALHDLILYFARNGQFYNTLYRNLGGDAFIEIEEKGRKEVNYSDYAGLVHCFKEEGVLDQKTELFYVNESNFLPSGQNIFGLSFVNRAHLNQQYEEIKKLTDRNPLWEDFDQATYNTCIEANELAHGILFTEFGFSGRSQRDWSKLNKELEARGIKMSSSKEAFEFLSDWASISQDKRFFLGSWFMKKDQKGYAFTSNLLNSLIQDILKAKIMENEKLSKLRQKQRESSDAQENFMKLTISDIIYLMDEDDLNFIQNKFDKFGRIVFDIVKEAK
ncbi:MAG: hypothetical protein GF347_04445 [Candidatus Moranbacteria bacterium]|nr:hypothetical protein [Candidatus Moranbacteria bacterium]